MSECCMTKEEIEKLLKYEKNETTDKFIKEDEQMSLETRKQSTEDIKEQAQELIDQAYQRGYPDCACRNLQDIGWLPLLLNPQDSVLGIFLKIT